MFQPYFALLNKGENMVGLQVPRQLCRSISSAFVYYLLFLLPLVTPVFGQTQPAPTGDPVPRWVKFSGVVKDLQGDPRSGLIGMTFALYKDEQGGNPLWLETQNVQVDQAGHYTVFLGATKSDGLPQDLFVSGDARWLGIQPEGQAEQPRTLLLSVPYALKAGDAATVGGLPPSAFVLATAANAASGSSGTGANHAEISGPNISGSGTQNYLPLWMDNNGTLGNSSLYQTGSGNSAQVGINTSTPAAALDINGSVIARGSLQLPATGTANANGGFSSQPVLLQGSAFNSNSQKAIGPVFQWQTEPTGNNTSNPAGTLNLLYGNGSGQPSETGLNIASNGQIKFATGQTFPGTGTITGVTAGAGLTGGGTSGNVTISINTNSANKTYARLGAANTFTANQIVQASLSANQLISAAPQGTAPLQVTSTTQVPNFNASLLGGFSASAFQPAGSYASLGANTFSGDQNVTGNVSATAAVSAGTGFNLAGNAFAFGDFSNLNAFLGFAGNSTLSGQGNTASGWRALHSNTSGGSNTASGARALSANTAGNENTGTGSFALYQNTTGGDNTATGMQTLYSNVGGNFNSAAGAYALQFNTTGNYNTGDGAQALNNNTVGFQNTASGAMALLNNVTGINNTALGFGAGPDTNSPSLTNATAIGAKAVVSASNALVLGGTGVNAVNVGIGTATPSSTLDVRGTGSFTGLVTFAPGQTFPGTGTITGVTAGAGLLGGGNSGNVSMGIDTSKIPQLSTANAFTGDQSITGNVIASGLLVAPGANLLGNNSTSILQVNQSGTGQGIFASATGLNVAGVYGTSSNSTGFGVQGVNTSSTGGTAIYGSTNSTSGVAVLGLAGATSGNPVAVQAQANSANGVALLATNTANGGLAGKFIGPVNVTGDLTTSGGVSAVSVNATAVYNLGGIPFAFGNYAGTNAFLGFAGNVATTGANNMGSGVFALLSNTSGFSNTASGASALASNTTGNNNTATGTSALGLNSTGSYNTATGAGALLLNTTGSFNTASGMYALVSNSTGGNNTASGYNAMYSNTTGGGNTATGGNALASNIGGLDNTANGFQSLESNTSGYDNTGNGRNSLSSNSTGANNTASGFYALQYNTTGGSNTAVGAYAGPDSTHSGLSNSTAIGANAEVTASNAMVLGSINGVNGATADTLVGIGTTAPAAKLDVHGNANFTGPITFAPGQTFPGAGTITGVTAGTDLIGGGSSGSVTLNVDTTKVVTGITAGTDLTGGGTGGVQTLGLDTTKVPQLAAANTFTGNQTVNGNLTATGPVTGGSFQTGGGFIAFGSVSSGNSFLGFSGGNTEGNGNTADGYLALFGNDTGQYNTAMGYQAQRYVTNGSYNTAIGANAITSALSNATAIGASATVQESNAMVLGSINGINNATADTVVGIGTTTPATTLDVEATAPAAVGPILLLKNKAPVQSGTFGDSVDFRFALDGGSSAGNPNAYIRAAEDGNSQYGAWISFATMADGGAGSGPLERMRISSNGLVGIGTASPDSLLTVNGSADKPGGGSWGTFSDRRLKNLDGEFQAGLREILKLQPVRYRYKQDNALGIHDHDEHVGFVAQDVQKVIPEAVSQNSQGYLLVNNDPILWTMLNAIKEQQSQIVEQRKQIETQHLEIQRALRRIASQDQQIHSLIAAVGSLGSNSRSVKLSRSKHFAHKSSMNKSPVSMSVRAQASGQSGN